MPESHAVKKKQSVHVMLALLLAVANNRNLTILQALICEGFFIAD